MWSLCPLTVPRAEDDAVILSVVEIVEWSGPDLQNIVAEPLGAVEVNTITANLRLAVRISQKILVKVESDMDYAAADTPPF